MARRGKTDRVLTWSWGAGGLRRRPDEVIVEEPLTIQLDDTLVATTMRTPGHDFELAVGFCHAEGMLAGAAVTGVRYCGTGAPVDTDFNVVTVETGGRAPAPTPRLGTTSSSCGLCGAEAIEELADRLEPLPSPLTPFPLDVLAGAPELVRPNQALFNATGGVHAAATITADGAVGLVREDIGRHNAVDKVVGRMLLDGTRRSGMGLFVSGRASFEMVQKAWAAGFGALVSVSAPSSLAVEVAARANMVLAGFARDGAMNVYTMAERPPG